MVRLRPGESDAVSRWERWLARRVNNRIKWKYKVHIFPFWIWAVGIWQTNRRLSLFSDFKVFKGRIFLHTQCKLALATIPLTLQYSRSYFYFRCIVFHLSTWPPLLHIRPPTCVAHHTFYKALESPLQACKYLNSIKDIPAQCQYSVLLSRFSYRAVSSPCPRAVRAVAWQDTRPGPRVADKSIETVPLVLHLVTW